MSRMILALSLLPTTAFGAVFTVPTDYATVQEAVDAASNGDTIALAAGTYDLALTIDKNLIIEALPDALVVLHSTGSTGQVIDVSSPATAFEIHGVTFVHSGTNRAIRATGLTSLTITDVRASDLLTDADGAFLLAEDVPNIVLDNVVVNGVVAQNGAAIHASQTDNTASGTLQISDSTFETGEATQNGGLIYVEHLLLTLTDSVVTDGFAENGGGVYIRGEGQIRRLRLNNTTISNSYATSRGGGAYLEGCRALLTEATFSANTASAGGGLWLDQMAQPAENLVIQTGSVFEDNLATGANGVDDGGGAAFYAKVDSVDIVNSTFAGNVGLHGALTIEANTVDLNGPVFSDNISDAGPGAMEIVATDVEILNATFTSNNAAGDGGALWVQADTLDIRRTVFAQNGSSGEGGALWVLDAAASLEDVDLADNTAQSGGAMAFRSTLTPPPDLTITASRFYRNQADADGGALHVTGVGAVASTRNHWCENVAGASGFGGAVHLVGSGAATFRNDAVNDNVSHRGGAFSVDGFDTVDLAFSTFAGNGATEGAVLFAGTIAGGTSVSHVAATGSTGVLFSATGTGPLTAERIGTSGNTDPELGGAWTGATLTDPVVLDDAFLYNNYPAPCADIRLYPHARNTTLRGGTGFEDVGLSGGPDVDPYLFVDADSDGFDRIDDCGDDDDPVDNPDAIDRCDGVDNDCDGVIDEDPDTMWFLDDDGDGYGDPQQPWADPLCAPPPGNYVDNDEDCDDTDPLYSPDAEEVCDGVDNDCDGTADVGASDALVFYRDQDLDGFGLEDEVVYACSQPEGYVPTSGDCDDTLAAVFPGATERCDTIDNDCDGAIDQGAIDAPLWYPDTDVDGYGDDTQPGVEACLPPLDHSPYGGDCDDTDPTRNPGRPEVCDGVDNDCDGTVDQDPITPLYYLDADGDGFGDASSTPIGSCTPVQGRIMDGSDCDDTDPTIHPGAVETCDGVDEDCDGLPDDNPDGGITYYLDADFDGHGNSDYTIQACSLPNGYAEQGGDCDDTRANVYPGADEYCDQFDNDCDGEIDEPDAIDAILWYADVDDDNYGDDNFTSLGCTAPIGHVPQGGDCDDQNPSAFPGRPEVCDGIDNDCNGEADGPDAADVQFFYRDADGDGFGDRSQEVGACFQPDGYTTNDTDCDDTNPDVYPSALEIPGNGIDEDCDGQDLPGEEQPCDPATDPECACDPATDPACDEGCGGCASGGGAPLALIPSLGPLLLLRRRP